MHRLRTNAVTVADAEEAVEEVEEEEDHGGVISDQHHPTELIIRPKRIKTNETHCYL